MDVIWLERARNNLRDILDYLEDRNPKAASNAAGQLFDAADLLGRLPRTGRKGRMRGTLDFVVADTNYLIRYRLRDGRVEILRVIERRSNWK